MKRFSVLVAALAVLATAASCSSSNTTTTAPADDSHPSFKATLLPANEVPPIGPILAPENTASGTATIDFNLVKDASGAITSGTVNFRVDVTGFPPTAAITLSHIHTGAAGVSGGVLVTANVNPGEITLVNGAATYSRLSLALKSADAQAIINNPAGFYFNVHTSANPQGVMRGQLVKQ